MIVGLTGGIGSGKSTVAKIFSRLAIPCYDSDHFAKTLIDTDKELQSELRKLMGNSIIHKNGLVNRQAMADLIFSNEALLKKVNNLIHPAVGVHFHKWQNAQSSVYILKEAAILFESGSYKTCDKVIVVSAPEELRITRVEERSGQSRSEIEARIAKQWPEEKKISLADYHIVNDGSQSLIEQVFTIHQILLEVAEKI